MSSTSYMNMRNQNPPAPNNLNGAYPQLQQQHQRGSLSRTGSVSEQHDNNNGQQTIPGMFAVGFQAPQVMDPNKQFMHMQRPSQLLVLPQPRPFYAAPQQQYFGYYPAQQLPRGPMLELQSGHQLVSVNAPGQTHAVYDVVQPPAATHISMNQQSVPFSVSSLPVYRQQYEYRIQQPQPQYDIMPVQTAAPNRMTQNYVPQSAQQMQGMHQAIAAQPPAQPARKKNVLKITDPTTGEDILKLEQEQQQQQQQQSQQQTAEDSSRPQSVDNLRTSERSLSNRASPTPSANVAPHHEVHGVKPERNEKMCQEFQREVLRSVMNDATPSTTAAESATREVEQGFVQSVSETRSRDHPEWQATAAHTNERQLKSDSEGPPVTASHQDARLLRSNTVPTKTDAHIALDSRVSQPPSRSAKEIGKGNDAGISFGFFDDSFEGAQTPVDEAPAAPVPTPSATREHKTSVKDSQLEEVSISTSQKPTSQPPVSPTVKQTTTSKANSSTSPEKSLFKIPEPRSGLQSAVAAPSKDMQTVSSSDMKVSTDTAALTEKTASFSLPNGEASADELPQKKVSHITGSDQPFDRNSVPVSEISGSIRVDEVSVEDAVQVSPSAEANQSELEEGEICDEGEGEIRDDIGEADVCATATPTPSAETPTPQQSSMDLVERLKKFYEETVFNPSSNKGEKVYSRQFMEFAQGLTLAQQKPNFDSALPPEILGQQQPKHHILPEPRSTSFQFRPNAQWAMPGFQVPAGASSSMQYNKTGSRGYSGRGSGQHQRSQKKQIIINRPSQIQVDLRTTENAWKPSIKGAPVSNDEEAQLQAMYKRVRGILNKITPQSFPDLLSEYVELNLNDEVRLRGVIDIIFDKTVEEPKYCSMYADFCSEVSKDQLKKSDNKSHFRSFLLNKCQKEFEREKNFEDMQKETLAEIGKLAEGEAKRKELQDSLDEMLIKEKRRMLGTMAFIGELYKRGMLTAKIMNHCIAHLGEKSGDGEKLGDDEYLECLLKLLTTVGSKLDKEGQAEILNVCCARLDRIMQSHPTSRIRFMIRDLLETRENKWELRQKDKGAGPMTLDELHRNIEMEKLQQKAELQSYEATKKAQQHQPYGGRGSMGGGDRYSGERDRGGPPGGKRQGNYQSQDAREDGRSERGGARGKQEKYTMRPAASSKMEDPKLFKGTLMKGITSNAESVSLRPGSGFQKKKVTQPVAEECAVQNKFSALAAAGISLQDSSAPSSRDSSRTRREVTKLIAEDRPSSLQPSPAQTPSISREGSRAVTPDGDKKASLFTEHKPVDISNYARNLLDELTISNDYEEASRLVLEVKDSFDQLVEACLNHAFDKEDKHRDCFAKLLVRLIENNVVKFNAVISSCEKFADQAHENGLQDDSPKCWTYLGVIIGHICSRVPQDMRALHVLVSKTAQKGNFLAGVLHTVLKSVSPADTLSHWKKSGLTFYVSVSEDEFRTDSELQVFLQKEGLSEFDMRNALDPVLIDFERFCRSNTPDCDQLLEYINNKNVLPESYLAAPNFVSALTDYICSTVTVNLEVNVELLETYSKALLRVCQAVPDIERLVLENVVAVVQKLDYPQGMMVTFIDTLLNCNVLVSDTIINWWNSIEGNSDFAMVRINGEVKRFMQALLESENAASLSSGQTQSVDQERSGDAAV